MPEVHFAASVTQNVATGGLQLRQSASGSTTSTYTLSVVPLPADSIPYCADVIITVAIPVDAVVSYYAGELAFVTEYVDVKTTSDFGRLSFGKFLFKSPLGGLYIPSFRTKALNVENTEGEVVIESLRSSDNESPVAAKIETAGII